MPFCPSCESEYDPKVVTCAECGIALVAALPADSKTGDTVDVYSAQDDQDAQRVAELLSSAGIENLLRELGSSAFPIRIGTGGEHRIAVDEGEAERARALLRAAVQDGVIGDGGQVV